MSQAMPHLIPSQFINFEELGFFLYLRKQKDTQHNRDIQVETKMFKKDEEISDLGKGGLAEFNQWCELGQKNQGRHSYILQVIYYETYVYPV